MFKKYARRSNLGDAMTVYIGVKFFRAAVTSASSCSCIKCFKNKKMRINRSFSLIISYYIFKAIILCNTVDMCYIETMEHSTNYFIILSNIVSDIHVD